MYKYVSAYKGGKLFEGLDLVKLNTSIQLQSSFRLGLKRYIFISPCHRGQ